MRYYTIQGKKKERLEIVQYNVVKDKELENLLQTVQILKKERDFLSKAASLDKTDNYVNLNKEIKQLKESIKEETLQNKEIEVQMKETSKKLERINTYPDELKEFRVLGEEHRIFYEQLKEIQTRYDTLKQNKATTDARLDTLQTEISNYPPVTQKDIDEIEAPKIDYEPEMNELKKQIEAVELQKKHKEAESYRKLCELEDCIQKAEVESKKLLPMYREKEQAVRQYDSMIKNLKRRLKSLGRSSVHLTHLVQMASFSKNGEHLSTSSDSADLASWSVESGS